MRPNYSEIFFYFCMLNRLDQLDENFVGFDCTNLFFKCVGLNGLEQICSFDACREINLATGSKMLLTPVNRTVLGLETCLLDE